MGDQGPTQTITQSITADGGEPDVTQQSIQAATQEDTSEISRAQEIQKALLRVEELSRDVTRQKRVIDQVQTITFLGFILVIIMVAAIIVSTVIFEAQLGHDDKSPQATTTQQTQSGTVARSN